MDRGLSVVELGAKDAIVEARWSIVSGWTSQVGYGKRVHDIRRQAQELGHRLCSFWLPFMGSGYVSVGVNGIWGQSDDSWVRTGALRLRYQRGDLGLKLLPYRGVVAKTALVLGQDPLSPDCHGLNHLSWCKSMTIRLRKAGWDVLWKPPATDMSWVPDGAKRKEGRGLDGIGALVTQSSNHALWGVLAGVPTIQEFEKGPHYRVCLPTVGSLEDPKPPSDRKVQVHLEKCANRQYTIDEIARGDLWERFRMRC